MLSNRGIIRTVIYVANYGLIASKLVDQARSNQAVMATLCDFLVKLLQMTPAPDQDPGPATDQDQGPATNFQGEDASKDKKGKGKAVVVDGSFERPLDHSTALALPKVVITELLDGHRCQCFECNPNIKENLKRQAVKATREVGLAELKEETRNL